MASPEGLFYAYAKHATTDWSWRYLIIFADRATADEWWRAVINSVASGYNRFAEVRRVSLQFYVHNPDIKSGNISQTITDDRCAKQFLGRVIFTLLNDRDGRMISAAPTLDYTDHISGRGYFIRSLLHRDQYWFFNGQRVIVSATNRTKFTITVQDKAGAPPNARELVMIGTDSITINVINPPVYLRVEQNGGLYGSPLPTPGVAIKFSDFNGGFMVAQADNSVVVNAAGGGEPWGLV